MTVYRIYTTHTQLHLLTIEFRTHRSVTFRFGNGQQREAGHIGYQCGNFQPLVYFFFTCLTSLQTYIF